MKSSHLALGLVVQVVALTVGGVWGAALGGVVIGIVVALSGGTGGFRTGFLAAFIATALLLGVAAFRGAPIAHFADMIGANFKLPGAALLALTLVLPALQSGGIAGGIGRMAAKR
jgi:hypothetical protein